MFSANSSQVSEDRLYVEDVFSTYLYDGTSASLTINNGIDLAGKGGLVWIKTRNAANGHPLFDTARGTGKYLATNLTSAETNASPSGVTAFNSNGFTVASGNWWNASTQTYASWTFRKAPKFFDVVTYTGNGSNPRSINHALGTTPGFIVIKNTGSTSNWFVLHRGDGSYVQGLCLNDTRAGSSGVGSGFGTPTSTQFVVSNADTNASGETYVAYLFAHDTTSDGIIQCGSYTGAGSPYTGGSEVTLGWEPQWVLIKSASNAANWVIIDNMRGWGATTDPTQNWLYPNTSGAENLNGNLAYLTPTGFKPYGSSLTNNTGTYIYIAIRRGPMRTPTSGTSVYNANSVTTASYSVGFAPDMALEKRRDATFNFGNSARLMGSGWLTTNTTNAYNSTASFFWDEITGNFRQGFDNPGFVWAFRRAPSFMDVVCYTGTGVARTVNHNLGIVPELMIVKNRSTSGWDWHVYAPSIGNDKYLVLNEVYGQNNGASSWDSTSPTATTFTVGTSPSTNNSGSTHVAYLFASCPGVSKCGSYTGNGSSQTINCGFAAGARFVMIKRTDSAGDWYVWDSARGIVSGNDPHLSLNTTAAEVTTDDSVDTDSSGFVVNQLSATNINVSSATYIYLAVA